MSHRDLAELGPVDAVCGGGDVPVVEEHPAALVGGDADMHLGGYQERDIRKGIEDRGQRTEFER